MPRSAERNAALYPPGPEPSTIISHSMSALPEYFAAPGAGPAPFGEVDAEGARPAFAPDWSTGAGGVFWPADAPAAAASRVRITLPSLTLSPIFTRSSFTVPAAGEGTSIVALSDSRVTSGSSG